MRVHGQIWALTLSRGEPPYHILADDLDDAIRGLALALDDRSVGERVMQAERLAAGGILLSRNAWNTVTRMVLD